MGGSRDWLNQGWLESSQDTQQVQLEKRAGKKGGNDDCIVYKHDQVVSIAPVGRIVNHS